MYMIDSFTICIYNDSFTICIYNEINVETGCKKAILFQVKIKIQLM